MYTPVMATNPFKVGDRVQYVGMRNWITGKPIGPLGGTGTVVKVRPAQPRGRSGGIHDVWVKWDRNGYVGGVDHRVIVLLCRCES